MKFRKILCAVLACTILFCSIPFGVSAENRKIKYSPLSSPVLYDSPADMQASVADLEKHVDTDRLRKTIFSAVSECKEEIIIEELNIPVSIAESIADFIWYNMPEAFNVHGIGNSYYGDTIYSVLISYREFADTKDEYAACYSEFKAVADGMLAGIEKNDRLTQVEKALLIHDRLILHTEYDYTSSSVIKHTAYGALCKRAAVCQGYAMAYMYLLDRVGIKNYYCSSRSLNHGWNIVYIDGVSYHTDVTWDDRSWGSGERGFVGRVDHDNFLRSTQGIKATGHNSGDFDSSPVDTRYDNSFWQSSSTAFQLIGNDIYYIDNEEEKLMRMSDNSIIGDVEDDWLSSGGGIWSLNYSCLSSAGGDLFYSLADGVYKYTVSNGKTQKIYAPELGHNFSVFGFTFEDGYLICDINNTPNNAVSLSQIRSAYSDISVIITGIEINTPPEKNFYKGDSADFTGLTLKINYSDESHDIISSGFTVSGFSSSKLGKNTLTVHYEDFTVSLDITINCRHQHQTAVEEKPATCQSTGHTAGVYCSDCDTYISGYAEIPVNENAHKWDSGTVTAIPSCSSEGEKTFTCLYKSSHKKTEKIGLNKDKHINTRTVAEAPPSSYAVGYTEGVYCDDCEKYISGHEEIPKKGHGIAEGKNATVQGNTVFVTSGITVAKLIPQSYEEAEIRDAEGRLLTAGDIFTTDSVIILPDKTYNIVISGDVDCDGFVSAADARLALRASVGLENFSEESLRYKAADVLKTDKLTAADARIILRVSVGLEKIEF